MEPVAATIAALATAPVAGGVGILRISGSHALEVTRALTPDVPPLPTPRHAYFTRFVDRAGALLDEGLFLYFEAPRSFTGEHVVELQVHGSPRLLQLLLAELLADDRLRLATAGEFTRRAFLAGKIDLVRAEAIADLVSAQSEAEVRAAAAQVGGALSTALHTLRTPLLALHADLEGVLNFPEEAEGAEEGAEERLLQVRSLAQELLSRAARGRLLRGGAKVVLFGPANAGKSTLFNALLEESRAIVDEAPGTTRDVLEASLELEGLRVVLHDTAGLREDPETRVEALGVARAREALRSADLSLLVLPVGTSEDDERAWRTEAADCPVVRIVSKCDLEEVRGVADARGVGHGAISPERVSFGTDAWVVHVSGRTGAGVQALRQLLRTRLLQTDSAATILALSERHRDGLRRIDAHLEQALAALRASTLEVVSGEVGLALEALAELTGESASTALLDAIFARFCIGK